MKPLSNGFHTHTMYGSLDGVASASDLIDRSIELGRNALTVTDHGSMAALPTIWRENENRKKKGKPHVQVIHGIEPYISSSIIERVPEGVKLKKYFHATFLFKNKEGFEWFSSNSLKADENSVTVFDDKKPIYILEDIYNASGNVVVGTGCLQGIVAQLFLAGLIDLAEEAYLEIREKFGKDNFFVELMPHKLNQRWVPPKFQGKQQISEGFFEDLSHDIQQSPNRFLFSLAKKHGDKMVISEDAHLATKDQKLIQDILLGNGKQKWRFSVAYSMEPVTEWYKTLQEQIPECTLDDIHEMIENSYKVSELCKNYTFMTSDDKIYLPNMKMIFGEDLPTVATLIKEIKKHGLLPNDKTYVDRLKEEIDVLINNGVADFIPYILLVYDVVNHFRKQNIFVTPRGSAGGSLILYLLGISIADPIKHGLSFARFLTKGRIQEGNFPDIDIDCAEQQMVFDYLNDKYKNCFCQVATEGKMKIKSAMKDVERVFKGSVSPETNEISKALGNTPQGVDDYEFVFGYEKDGSHIDGIFDGDEESAVNLRKWSEDNSDMWKSVVKCLGTIRSLGVHACACLITPTDISSIVPLKLAKNGALACQYTHQNSEYIGAIKYDFLSVDALKSISLCFNLIKKHKHVDLIWEEFSHDKEVFENIIKANRVSGVFQMSARALRPYVKKMPPKNITEISNILALVRPGALEAPSPRPDAPDGETAAEFYVACSNGRAEPFFVHDDLRDIIGETYSVILYQEQIMQVFIKLAGYSDGDAAAAMKAVSKKKKDKLEKHCNDLRKGCESRGWNKEQIEYLINSVMASARYSFNKSHSLAYAVNAYIECWLKYYYPVEFWCAKLTAQANKSESDKALKTVLDEAVEYLDGFDIQNSEPFNFTINNNRIKPPIMVIKGVGLKAAIKLMEYSQSFKWETLDGFIEQFTKDKKLDTQRKKEGLEPKTHGINIIAIAILLYHGVFDKYIDGKPCIEKYEYYLNNLKNALKSKAKCVDIADIKTQSDLIEFKMSKNPLFCLDKEEMLNNYKNTIINKGFFPTHKKIRIFTSGILDVYNSIDHIYRGQLYKVYAEGIRESYVFCYIKSVGLHTSKKGTIYMKVEIDTGFNQSYKFTVFANRYSKTIDPELLVVLKPGRFCLLGFKPNVFNNEKGGIINKAIWLGDSA